MMYTKRSQREREGKRPNDVAINGSTRRRAHLRPRRISDAAAAPGPVAIIARTKSAAVLWPKHATQQTRTGQGRGQGNPTRFEGRRVWASVSAATNQCKDFFTINCVIESFRRRRSTQQRQRDSGVGGGVVQGGCTWQQGRGRGKFN